jgi:hypothetical protein
MDNPKFSPINTYGIPVNAVPYELCELLSLRAVPHFGEFTAGSYNLIFPTNIMKIHSMNKVPPMLEQAIDRAKPMLTECEYFIINYDATHYVKKKLPLKSTGMRIISSQTRRHHTPVYFQRVG